MGRMYASYTYDLKFHRLAIELNSADFLKGNMQSASKITGPSGANNTQAETD